MLGFAMAAFLSLKPLLFSCSTTARQVFTSGFDLLSRNILHDPALCLSLCSCWGRATPKYYSVQVKKIRPLFMSSFLLVSKVFFGVLSNNVFIYLFFPFLFDLLFWPFFFHFIHGWGQCKNTLLLGVVFCWRGNVLHSIFTAHGVRHVSTLGLSKTLS